MRNLFHLSRISLCLIVAVIFAAQAQESSPISTSELVNRSGKIVTGQVVSQYSAWDESGRQIYTYYKLRVEQSVKSAGKDSTIVIRQLGGKVGDIQSHVAGQPDFREGERVLVFLGPFTGTNYYGLIDWVAGKYEIQANKAGEDILIGGGDGHGESVKDFIATLRRHQ